MQFLLRLSTVLLALAVVAGTPRTARAAGPYGEDDLVRMYQIAIQEYDSHDDRCVLRDGAVRADADAERAFARSALNLSLFVAEYPFPPGREADRGTLVHRIVLGYERAFDCNAVWDKRAYLNHAMAAIEAHLKHVREVEKRPLTENDVVVLIQDRKRVQTRLDALRQPVCPQCPVVAEPPAPKPAEEPRGYRRWIDRLSLRIELGGGAGRVLSDEAPPAIGPTFALHISQGVRFLAGQERRHVFVVGFLLGYERVAGEPFPAPIYSTLGRFEYGFRISPKWFSLHGALEAGIAAQGDEPFGRAVIGSSWAACTWGEALCARIRHHWADPKYSELSSVVGLVGLDFFRVVDNHLLKEGSR